MRERAARPSRRHRQGQARRPAPEAVPSQIAAARAVAAGLHVDQVADAFGISRVTLYRQVS